jgi:opacity protein-like surface antigen
MFSRNSLWIATLALGVASGLPLSAQNKWEAGGAASAGFFSSKTLNGGSASATTGFKTGAGAAFWLGNDFRNRFGGEIRYMFQKNSATLKSGATTLDFAAFNHQFTYDFLIYSNSNKARVRPYLLVGGGVKAYQGRGTEQALQPLLQFAALTHTTQWRGVGNVGGGVKFDLTDRVVLRFEVRDSITQFPSDVILPVPPNKVGGIIHNITPSFGIAYRFE